MPDDTDQIPTAEDLTDAPAQPGPQTLLTQRQIWLVMVGLLLGVFLAALDQTIVSTALPTIVGDLHGATHLSWVVTAYLLLSTASTPMWGKLGDQFGRKRFFQLAIVIFVIGSIMSGLSRNMPELIAFRAVQGLGGGGLMVGSQAAISDVVAPRDRGRYQGAFGAMFGISSIVGPLLGGFFVDDLSWRWIFYVNVPISLVALVVTSAVLPGTISRRRHRIDYLGNVLIALAATALILMTSLGGVTLAWSSPVIILLAVAGVVLIGLWILAERRASEPVMPLKLFRNRTFVTTSAVSFVVGFSMFGAITFIPVYLQVVRGVSPTYSGIRLIPMMVSLLITSIISGQMISRWGRYKIFPLMGTVLMGVGLLMMSRLGVNTSELYMGVAFSTIGLGLGMTLQVMVLVVQNAVPFEEMGAATSGITFFRSIGASFGVSVYGAVLSNVLIGNLRSSLKGIPTGGLAIRTLVNGASPALLDKLQPAVHSRVVEGFAASLHPVFLLGVPIAALGCLVTLVIPELALRKSMDFRQHDQASVIRDEVTEEVVTGSVDR